MDKEQLMKQALEKIRQLAYENALFSEKCDARILWDIYWLALAGIEGKEKASALATAEKLSGVPTGGPTRELDADSNT